MTEPVEMVLIPGGKFWMGAENFYPEEVPRHVRPVRPFPLVREPVPIRQFARFVADTGYVTVAERPLDQTLYRGLPDADLVPGSLVFTPTDGPVPLDDWRRWWAWVPGASWRRPSGHGSTIDGLDEHPVVQVCHEDAVAYAHWAGKRLPTEAEWEFAARGGLEGRTYAWGDQAQDGENLLANTWQGNFPYRNTGAKGWRGTSPVGTFPANGYGLVDMTGNVWEWTSDYFTTSHALGSPELGGCGCGCGPDASTRAQLSMEPGSPIPRRVLKGGSHLCAPEYCLRYRPAARSPQAEDSATTHIGFRCARSVE